MAYIILFIGILTGVVGQYFFRAGVERSGIELNSIGNVIKLMFTPAIIIGLGAYGLSTVFYLLAIDKIPQEIAYPSLAVGYILVLLYSAWFFGASITPVKVIGIITIIAGVVLLFSQNDK